MTGIAQASRETGTMLAAATWISRLGATALIAILTFAISPTFGGNLAVEIVAYLMCLAVLGYWCLTDLKPATLHRGTLEIGLATMAASAGVAFLAPNGTALIGFSVMAVLTAGADAAATSGWLIGVTAILAVEVSAILHDAGTGSVVGYPLLLIACFIGGRNRRAYRVQAEQSAALLGQIEQLRAEQRRVAVLDERTRIAREIHDVLAHSLGALGIQIQTVRAVLADTGDVDRALALLDQAHRLASDGLVETRRAVHALRGDGTQLDTQLATLVQTHRARHSTAVQLIIDGEPTPLPVESTVALIRTAQEALVNAAKHAPTQAVQVHLSYDDDQVLLAINNRLPHPENESEASTSALGSVDGGYGLIGMRERLMLINGSLDTTVGVQDWIVTAQVPR